MGGGGGGGAVCFQPIQAVEGVFLVILNTLTFITSGGRGRHSVQKRVGGHAAPPPPPPLGDAHANPIKFILHELNHKFRQQND